MVWAMIFLVITVLLFLAVWKLDVVSYILDIRPTERGIEFRLFRFLRFYILPFSNIDHVEELVDGGFLSHPLAYNCKNRLFSKTYLIQKKKGFFTRQVLVTPADSNAFKTSLAKAYIRVLIQQA